MAEASSVITASAHQAVGQCAMQRAQAEHLRCVGLPDQAAVNGLDDATMLVYTLEGIAGRHSQQATHRIVREFGEQFVEIVTTQVRPRRIMHQDPIIIAGTQGIELQQTH
jgi:hypothetical protein